MATDSDAPCEDVYSAWEKHKLAVAGARRLAMATFVAAALLLAADFALFRTWRPPEAPSGMAARAALGGLIALSALIYIVARRSRAEFAHPFRVGTTLLLLAVGVGAFAAASAGGPAGYYSFGLVPLLFTWAIFMPGGFRESVLPTAGGLIVHLLVLQLTSGAGLAREGKVMVVALVLSVAGSVACGQVIEFWRRRAAAGSTTDWLTGALSRDFLTERLNALCTHRQRSLAPLSLVMLDIDRFKNINDTHGRNAGDEVLEILASGVMAEIRGNDFVGRYGGDEFLLVLDECEGANAVALVERLRRKVVESPISVGAGQIRVSFSAGIVSVRSGDPLSCPDLLRAAEKALEESKETGRNRTTVTATEAAEEPVTQP